LKPVSRNDRVAHDEKLARVLRIESALTDDASFSKAEDSSLGLQEASIEQPSAKRRRR
jgi:hypothetical protein